MLPAADHVTPRGVVRSVKRFDQLHLSPWRSTQRATILVLFYNGVVVRDRTRLGRDKHLQMEHFSRMAASAWR